MKNTSQLISCCGLDCGKMEECIVKKQAKMYQSLGFRESKEVRHTIWEKEFREMQMVKKL